VAIAEAIAFQKRQRRNKKCKGGHMGMFDSFYTNEGKEIQTKKLNCVLDSYYIGGTVPNYELNFDGATGNYYLIEEYANASVIIINNIFIGTLIDQ
jgi:hypothetical protein